MLKSIGIDSEKSVCYISDTRSDRIHEFKEFHEILMSVVRDKNRGVAV